MRLGSGPEARGKETWGRAGLEAKIRVNKTYLGISNIKIMKALIIIIKIAVCRALI